METSEQKRAKLIHRIKIIQGHLRAIEKMMRTQEKAVDIVHQSMAVQKALKKMDMEIIKHHIEQNIVEQFQNNQIEKSVKELMLLYDMK